MIVIRNFQAEDADGVSALFREVYADRYVYSDLYVPTMIAWHNEQHHWYSVVAVQNDRIIGHAALWRHDNTPCAELAIFATHPAAQHRGVATRLGIHLCREAHKQQLATLIMKMVCSHPYSQLLAKKLGFQATALLRDYVTSPFDPDDRESVILGIQALLPRPVPQIVETHSQDHWLSLLSAQFGATKVSSPTQATSPLDISDIEGRVEVTIHQLTHKVIDEIARLPRSRLIYLRTRIDSMLTEILPTLYRAGYRDMGLTPTNEDGWFWLFQRGFRQRDLQLCCPVAQALHMHSLPA